MASKDGAIKRRLGLTGDYRRHRDTAIKAVLDDAFYLAIATSVIQSSWIMRLKFTWTAKRINQELDAMYASVRETI